MKKILFVLLLIPTLSFSQLTETFVFNTLSKDTLSRRTVEDIDKIQYLFSYFQPIVDSYATEFKITNTELMDMIILLFIYESGDSKGRLGKNRLFLNGYNGFGIKYKIGVRGYQIQYKCVRDESGNENEIPFIRFHGMDESINCLLGYVLAAERYNDVREAATVKDFIKELYNCGYITDSKRAENILYMYKLLF